MCDNRRYPLCQTVGCRRRPDRAIELDLVESWEASRQFRTATIHVGLCASCAREAESRVQAMLEARGEYFDLLHIITMAVPYEREQREKLERAEAEIERRELEVGGLRDQLRDAEAELRLCRALRSAEQRRLAVAGGAL